MFKGDKKYYFLIALILILTATVEILKPKQIDWKFSLDKENKEPYGLFVLYQTINDLFRDNKIITNNKTTYEFAEKNNKLIQNYIYISENFLTDELETQTILNLIKEGNTVFISAHVFSQFFTDTLNLSVVNTSFFDTTSSMNFYNKNLKSEQTYTFGKESGHYYFDTVKTRNTLNLAYSAKGNPVFLKKSIGKGNLFLNTTPEVFTNYAMITEKNYEFAYKILSYFPNNDIVWDDYYKPFKNQKKHSLSFIFANKSFKTAYYIILITAFIFTLFTIKRKQRIIPEIKPFINKTKEFAETISRVYFHKKNHKDIAEKKYTHFRSFLQNKYSIKLSDNEKNDYKKIAEKTGTDFDEIQKILLTKLKINKLERISADQLNEFNNFIEEFYEKCI